MQKPTRKTIKDLSEEPQIQKVYAGLMSLGLSEYESKTYVALVGVGEANARELHEVSGVPRTRVYDILRKLVKKGFVLVQEGSPTHYKPVEPREVIGRLKDEIIVNADESLAELENLKMKKRREMSLIWVVRGEWTVKSKIEELVSSAKEELTVGCSNPDFFYEILGMAGENVHVTCVFIGGFREELEDKLREMTFESELEEFNEFSNTRDNVIFKLVNREEIKTPFLDKLVKTIDGIEDDGVRFELESIIIADGKRSILVLRENGRKMAVVINLPFIVYLQKSMLDILAGRC